MACFSFSRLNSFAAATDPLELSLAGACSFLPLFVSPVGFGNVVRDALSWGVLKKRLKRERALNP